MYIHYEAQTYRHMLYHRYMHARNHTLTQYKRRPLRSQQVTDVAHHPCELCGHVITTAGDEVNPSMPLMTWRTRVGVDNMLMSPSRAILLQPRGRNKSALLHDSQRLAPAGVVGPHVLC